uniref:Uncharacterized protein n=1 Tax=Fagus sylvatica TaxID=28930 RepID=A0A2N9FGU4_FAGSY
MAPGSRGAGAFLCVFLAKIPVERGMPPANRELHIVAGVVIFHTHLGSRVNLQRVGKTLRAKVAVREKNVPNLRLIFPCFLFVFACIFDLAPDVGFRHSWHSWKACAALFFKVLGSREAELGFARYGSANMGCRSVFGPLEDIFPIGIPARPGKILVQALHRGELRFARYDLANRGYWNVPHAKGSFSDRDSGLTGGALDDLEVARVVSLIQLLVWSTVRSNLGQTWSTLVKALRTLGNVSRTAFCGFFGMVDPSRVRNGSVKPRSTLVKLGQPWENLVGFWEICPGPRFEDSALAHRFFPTRCNAIRKSITLRERRCSDTTCNSRIAKIFPGLAEIAIGKTFSGEPKTLRWPLFAGPYQSSPSSVSRKSRTLRKKVRKSRRIRWKGHVVDKIATWQAALLVRPHHAPYGMKPRHACSVAPSRAKFDYKSDPSSPISEGLARAPR